MNITVISRIEEKNKPQFIFFNIVSITTGSDNGLGRAWIRLVSENNFDVKLIYNEGTNEEYMKRCEEDFDHIMERVIERADLVRVSPDLVFN